MEVAVSTNMPVLRTLERLRMSRSVGNCVKVANEAPFQSAGRRRAGSALWRAAKAEGLGRTPRRYRDYDTYSNLAECLDCDVFTAVFARMIWPRTGMASML